MYRGIVMYFRTISGVADMLGKNTGDKSMSVLLYEGSKSTVFS